MTPTHDTFELDNSPALDLTAKITKLDTWYCRAGGYGDVHKAHYTSNEGVREVAVKTFRCYFTVYEHAEEARKAKMLRRELGIWRRLCHPKIVPFLGIVHDFERNGTTSLVSEWMPNGTLRDFIARNDDRLTLPQRLQLLSDIANGLFYLHSFNKPRPVVHGDLTCTNVLINREFNACLTDFGFTSMLGDLPESLGYLQMTSMKPGVLRYAAPELVNGDVVQPTTKSDIYSFGNLALLTLSGKRPWSEIPRDFAIAVPLSRGDRPSRPQHRSIEDRHWEELIERCWFPVNQRPYAEDIVSSLEIFLDSCFPTQYVAFQNPDYKSDIAQVKAIHPVTRNILSTGKKQVYKRPGSGESPSGSTSDYTSVMVSKMPLHSSLTSFVAEELRRYVCTDIPHRFVNTCTMTFVERADLFDIFSSEIGRISHEIEDQMEPNSDVSAEMRQHMALRETIQDVVKYATLSHCWTNDEPSYRDLNVGRLRESSGFKKLSHFCGIARSHGYNLAWSDTCCINDSDKRENNEAVQSMSSWCSRSHLCIVYLADTTSYSDFPSDTWFTRSWPLLELLVHRRIKFYNQHWQAFTKSANDKDDEIVTAKVSAATHIPKEVLVADNRGGVKGRGVWEIMSWASNRKTTRVEDAAYSLYGLFGITPEVSYGEGDHAFHNLARAIVEGKYSWDVFAWTGAPSQYHSALPSSPRCYPEFDNNMVGRDIGMIDFSITAHGWCLISVPLIPLNFHSSEPIASGASKVTLRPRPTSGLGRYGDLAVVCGALGLRHLRYAEDLHACILNYRSAGKNRGELKVGKEYICLLLHSRNWLPEGPTWVKFTTDNQLRIFYREIPLRLGSEPQADMFTFPLESVYVERHS